MMENTDSDVFTSPEITSTVMISKAGSDILDFPPLTSTTPVQPSNPILTSFPEHLDGSPDFDEVQGMEDIQLTDGTSKSSQLEFKTVENQPEGCFEGKEIQQSGTQTSSAKELKKDNFMQVPVTITVSKASDEESIAATEPEGNEELSTQFEHTTVIHSLEESTEDTFQRLKDGCVNGTLTHKEIFDGLFNVLVGGAFDLESRFIIECSENVEKMLEFIEICPLGIQAEIWSVFVAIVRKSFRNLEACSRVGLISKCLDRLRTANAIISDLLVQLLGVLTSYSITVKETKHLLRALHAKNGVWNKNSSKLLSVMQEMPKRDGADVFFSFPGKASAGISLPPLHRWPYQNGWTFSTWFRMDPLNSVNFEKEKPYLFSFLTAKGLGYQCYFMGNCLVLRCIRGSNKETTRCVKQELTPRKWHHVAISYVYSRWAKSEVHCYIDGQLLELVDASWVVSTSDYFDRCFIGCGTEPDVNEAFCGQLAAIYVFSQSISVQQATCLFCIGPAYQSHFKHDAESNLPDSYKKHLFDGHLHNSLVFAYCPKNYHGQLCLFPASKNQNTYFVQVPHAIMKEGVEVITTHSIHNSLHSVGGIQMLLPLFAQIDMAQEDGTVDYEICSTLLSVISLLLFTSPSAQQQLFHSQGFLIIAHVLNSGAKEHITIKVLETFIEISDLQNSQAGVPLLKQLFDHVFFTPQLWVRSSAVIQLKLYNFLATDFFNNPNCSSIIRRTPTIIGLIHTLKVFYWVVQPRQLIDPQYSKVYKFEEAERLDRSSIVQIRGYILQLINKLMFILPAGCEEKDLNRDAEFQAIFNFISTVEEDDNLYDMLTQVMRQMCQHPAVMVPAFDRKQAVVVILKLASSGNELIRIPALKIFGYFLCRSTMKRKNESINHLNLLHLLSERLLLNSQFVTLATYNVLFEILVEQMCPEVLFVKHEDPPLDSTRFENAAMLKVIANLIIQSEESPELLRVKKIFLMDLIRLCKECRENRRVILQMSVWQEWLISLAYISPETQEEGEISGLVYHLFSILLFHAIRLEYGGWRVWVDTLAITHSKVSWQNYRRKLIARNLRKAQALEGIKEHKVEEHTSGDDMKLSASNLAGSNGELAEEEEHPLPLYRTPDFVWTPVHIKLLKDLLMSIEGVVEEWVDSSIAMVDHVNNSDNQVFVSNTIHVLSQLIDSLIMACGGLLPLLAAATAPNSELEILDTTQQGLSILDAVHFLQRFVELADVFIFVSGINFNELEQEKNMPSGGILRQSLRLASTMAVRNILACRIAQKDDRNFFEISISSPTKYDAILKFVDNAMEQKDPAKGISDPGRLLQNIDLQRLKGIIYRDMEEGRQAQFLALSVVYLLSVLMVSRYRDILEPPTSPSPFFDTNADSSARKKSVDSASVKSKPLSKTSIEEGISTEEMRKANGQATISSESTAVTPKDQQEGIVENGEKTSSSSQAANGIDEPAKQSERDYSDSEEDEPKQVQHAISSIKFENTATEKIKDEQKYGMDHLSRFNSSNIKNPDAGERRQYLTSKLQKALESVAPLLREIMSDFRSFLQKTLLGTHGQEIMNDTKVMHCLKSHQGSVVELVMLLCSQEWQTSLQKHAGLAFIELVNEGRLMAHATRDHILRVANEADFILKRLRAEDVSKHGQFEKESNEQLLGRLRDEQVSDHLISSSKRRDFLTALKLLEKMRAILLSPSGAWWSDKENDRQIFWRLDLWEDDSRRRKRFVPNVYGGCRHSMAMLKTAVENGSIEADRAHEQLLKDLAHRMMEFPGAKLKTGATLNELVDESDIEKWASEENDLRAQLPEQASFSTEGKLIAPGIVVPGTISITATDVYFDADEEDPLYKQQDPRCLRFCDNLHGRWHFQEIRAIFLRRYTLQYVALELFLASRTAIMFAFTDQETVKKVVEHLPRVGVGVKYGLPQARKTSLMSPRQLFKHSDMPSKWQRREISNFDYLMFLNTIAGRTYNDLNQYPIFPWILSNYTSEKLDLSEASNFRDLSKPIGALSESRKKYFQERFNNWDDESISAFHYGTHYSTQAFTVNWLFRIEPFATFFLNLQSGRFDNSNRLFHSLAETWDHCQKDTHDVKEIIPELFYLPEMFYNNNDYTLGKREDGVEVNNVVLPPWALSPEHFVMVHRQALESDLVSCQLNQWIDLIFGYKQRGPEAVRATNVFYYLTYEGAVNLNSIESKTVREGIQQQILNFGQTPVQLMTEPHPPRHSIMTMSPLMFQPCTDDLCMLMKFISNSPLVHITANTFPQLQEPSVLTITQNLIFAINRWNANYNQSQSQSSGSLSSSFADKKSDTAANSITQAELPLTVDPLLAVGNPSQPPSRRHLGDAFDQRLNITWSNFVCTVDSAFIFACGYPDYSFRLIETENATVRQVIYGHGDVVTCLARSEASLFSDCYIASGSLDCTVVLWHYNYNNQAIAGEYNTPGEAPSPRAILTGHDSEVTAICISAEHGIVISGSKGSTVLMHTTQGDLLRHIVCRELLLERQCLPITNLLLSRDCHFVVFYGHDFLATFTTTGRQLNRPAHKSAEKILCAVLSRDGEYVVLGTANGRISILRLFPLQLLYTFPQTDSPTRCIAVSTNQRLIFGGLESGAVVVFNVDFNKWHYEYRQRYTYR